jgi:hypothetical protein
VVGYLGAAFKVPRSTAFEYRSLARRLDEVPRIVAAFAKGCFSYAVLRQLLRIADSETEDVWLELATDPERSAKAVIAEVRDAERTGRRRPRKESHGLPNLVSRITLDLTREQLEVVHTALDLFASSCGPAQRSETVEEGGPPCRMTMEEGLVALSQWIVDHGGVGGDESEIAKPATRIIYHHCPSCRASTV